VKGTTRDSIDLQDIVSDVSRCLPQIRSVSTVCGHMLYVWGDIASCSFTSDSIFVSVLTYRYPTYLHPFDESYEEAFIGRNAFFFLSYQEATACIIFYTDKGGIFIKRRTVLLVVLYSKVVVLPILDRIRSFGKILRSSKY
jgi:hypothetical protein